MDDEKNTLEELIKAIAGEDPFWRMLLTKYLDGLSSKSEKDKIYFLNKLGKNVELSSNFLKEINRGADANELFDKYNEVLINNSDERITLEQAKIMAEKDLQCNDKRIILSIRETDEVWIFAAGIPGVVSYGGRNMISINKSSGEIKLFVLPNKENFDILHNSKVIYDFEKR